MGVHVEEPKLWCDIRQPLATETRNALNRDLRRSSLPAPSRTSSGRIPMFPSGRASLARPAGSPVVPPGSAEPDPRSYASKINSPVAEASMRMCLASRMSPARDVSASRCCPRFWIARANGRAP